MDTKNEHNITIGGKNYVYEGPLTGRGQAGMAGFYTCDNKRYLIKEDDPGTCLAESLVVNYKPTGKENNQSPIIQAEIQTIERNGELISISIQEAFVVQKNEEPVAFDIVLLGHKREPNTWSSEESRNSNNIKNKIATLDITVKKELAYAIYTSQLNGDESLHTGQFLVAKNKDSGDITSIKRIDFGALGRYGSVRENFDPMHTSQQYANSGQWYKDYVSYLVEDKEVADEVIKLWNNTKTNEVIDAIRRRFSSQINNITDDDIKKTALLKLGASLSKDPKTIVDPKLELGELIDKIESDVIQAASKRVEGYHTAAQKTFKNKDVILYNKYKIQFNELRKMWEDPDEVKSTVKNNYIPPGSCKF